MARAARLRHKVTVQSPSYTPDSAGGVSGWTDVVSARAGIEPLRGRERAARDKFVDEVDVMVVLRYQNALSAVKPTWRVKHLSECCGTEQLLGVQAVIIAREARHRDLELACRRVDTGEPVK
jgi:head-tail adaptor